MFISKKKHNKEMKELLESFEKTSEIIYERFIPKKYKQKIDSEIKNIWPEHVYRNHYGTELLMQDNLKLKEVAKIISQERKEKLKNDRRNSI